MNYTALGLGVDLLNDGGEEHTSGQGPDAKKAGLFHWAKWLKLHPKVQRVLAVVGVLAGVLAAVDQMIAPYVHGPTATLLVSAALIALVILIAVVVSHGMGRGVGLTLPIMVILLVGALLGGLIGGLVGRALRLEIASPSPRSSPKPSTSTTSPNSSSSTPASSSIRSTSPNLSLVCAAGSIQLIGSSAFMPIAHDAASAYMQACRGATIQVSDGDAAYGLTQTRNAVAHGSESVIAMYDGLSTDTTGLTPHAMGILIFSVVAHSGLFPSGITTEALPGIFVKPGEPGVVAVGRRAGSGTRLTFITKVLKLNLTSPDLTPDKGSCPPPTGSAVSSTSCTEGSTADLLNFVDGTPNAIGYAEFYQPSAGYPNVSQLNINGVPVSRDNVLNGKYSFWAVEHLYAAMQPTMLAKDFLDYLPQYIKQNSTPDFIPCSADTQKKLESDC